MRPGTPVKPKADSRSRRPAEEFISVDERVRDNRET
jgi:hypothetical protein